MVRQRPKKGVDHAVTLTPKKPVVKKLTKKQQKEQDKQQKEQDNNRKNI